MCGLRRSYADAVVGGGSSPPATADASGVKPPTQVLKQSTRSQLDQITLSLQSSLEEMKARTTAPRTATPAPATDAVTEAPAVSLSRADLVKKLKRYEAMLELCKDDETDPVRLDLVQKVAATKAELSAKKPLGAQLDSARQALQRATSRREEADKALAAAQLLRDTAVSEETSAKAEVANLESMVVPPDAQTDLMASIQTQLAQLLSSMKDDGNIPAEHIANAEKHVSELVLGFTEVYKQATALKDHAAKSDALAKGIPTNRLRGKKALPASIPLPEIPTHPVRNLRKQPGKIALDNVFQSIHRGRGAVRSRSRGRCLSLRGAARATTATPSSSARLMYVPSTLGMRTLQMPRSPATYSWARCR